MGKAFRLMAMYLPRWLCQTKAPKPKRLLPKSPQPKSPLLYIAPLGAEAAKKAVTLTHGLRAAGIAAECDLMGRSLKSQMKYADKIGARFSVVLGDDEIANGAAKLKNMESGEQTEIPLGTEDFVGAFTAAKLDAEYRKTANQ